MVVLETRQLGKDYGQRSAVADVNLELQQGELFGFLGPNGAGKTTTIRMLLGFLRPSRGQALIFGKCCWRDSRRIKESVGYLPGDLRLYPWLTGELAEKVLRRTRKLDSARNFRELAERFDLGLDLRAEAMSRGMRQKLGLLLALSPDPQLLILDEPTMSLDPLMQERLKQYLLERAELGRTIFFSSHTLSEVERLCHRVLILRGGRVITDAPVAELRRQALQEVTVTWPEGAIPSIEELPAELRAVEIHPRRWRCQLVGSLAPVLTWLARQQLEDLAISPPNLEQLFHQYYHE
jgi:ABC-2 type transport system ATP-binding protein